LTSVAFTPYVGVLNIKLDEEVRRVKRGVKKDKPVRGNSEWLL
jgi:CTP-dependent riboflavin kinase